LLLTLDSGERAALVVERGRVLKGGDRVRTQDGREIEIIAAEEALLEASSAMPIDRKAALPSRQSPRGSAGHAEPAALP
jgi:urease accessory protein UreE